MRYTESLRRTFRCVFVAALSLFTVAAPVIAADTVSVSNESGYTRVLFTLAPEAQIHAASSDGISVSRPTTPCREARP